MKASLDLFLLNLGSLPAKMFTKCAHLVMDLCEIDEKTNDKQIVKHANESNHKVSTKLDGLR